jgi:selenocysteine lyase/cysteine desulfurase
MDAQQLRDSLPVTRDYIYLNTGWAGPTPESVLRRISVTLEREAEIGPASSEGLALTRGIIDEARAAIASLVGADAEDVIVTHSTTEGVNVVLHGMEWKQDDELLICDLEHPALTGPAQVLAQRYGVRVVRAVISPQARQAQVLEAVKSAISSKTRLVALSHIQFTCGLLMPIKEIAKAAHERGVPLLVDGAQSIGQLEVNMDELESDFYALSGQKWLMGPVGTGALYVRREHRPMLEPLFTTNAIADEREGSRSPLARFQIASQNPGLVAGLTEAVRMAAETGMAEVERQVMLLANLLRERVVSISGCTLLSPSAPESACGLVTVGLDGWPPDALQTALLERFSIVARVVRNPDGVRFSTAYFNTEREMEQVGEALGQIGATKYAAD